MSEAKRKDDAEPTAGGINAEQPEGQIDLLANLDLADPENTGSWVAENGEVRNTDHSRARIDLDLGEAPSPPYRFTLDITRNKGKAWCGFGLPLGELGRVSFMTLMDNSSFGLERYDGLKMNEEGNPTLSTGKIFPPDERTLLELTVLGLPGSDDVEIEVAQNGESVFAFAGKAAHFAYPYNAAPDRFTLGSGPGAYTIHRATVTPLNPASLTTTLMPPTSIPEDAVAFAGNHYQYFNQRLRWADAAEKAREMGGYLVSIHSKAENDFVRSLLPPSPPGQPWIGLSPQEAGQPWAWEDGTTTANYSHWRGNTKPAIGKPDGTPFRGSIRADNGTWGVVSHGFSGPYIVEWGEPGNLPAPTSDPSTTSIPAPAGDATDLLAALDPATHKIGDAIWSRNDRGITLTGGRVGMLIPPVPVPKSYDLEFRILPRSQMAVTFPIGDRAATLVFNKQSTPSLGGIEVIDGMAISTEGNPTAFSPTPFNRDAESTVLIRVREKPGDLFSIEALHNGAPLTSWEGEASVLTNAEHWTLPEPHRLGLGMFYGLKNDPGTWLSATLRPVDAASTITNLTTSTTAAGKKLATLLTDYSQKFQAAFGKAHADKITSLNTNYAAAVERNAKSIAAAGDLDAVLAFKTETEALTALNPGEVLLAPLPATAPRQLQDMRATYRKTIQGYEQTLATGAAPALRALDRELEKLTADFTRSRDIEAALEVRTFRDQLKIQGVALLTGTTAIEAPSAWVPLFNGINLEGWSSGPADFARVDPEEGVLIFQGDQRGDFYYNGNAAGGTYTDFEFKSMVKTIEKSNSGVFLHITSATKQAAYEVQIANQNQDSRKTGSIWGVKDLSRMHARDGDWFELHIKVEDKTITVAIDGKEVNKFTDPGDGKQRLSQGSLMLQWNKGPSPESAVHWKDIRIRPLD
jgi:hypothetical protein